MGSIKTYVLSCLTALLTSGCITPVYEGDLAKGERAYLEVQSFLVKKVDDQKRPIFPTQNRFYVAPGERSVEVKLSHEQNLGLITQKIRSTEVAKIFFVAEEGHKYRVVPRFYYDGAEYDSPPMNTPSDWHWYPVVFDFTDVPNFKNIYKHESTKRVIAKSGVQGSD